MSIVSESVPWVEIPVGRRLLAKVDEGDAWLVQGRKWTFVKNGHCLYAASPCSDGSTKAVMMHRLLLSPREGEVVDHRNGDGLDNRRANLRVCTHANNLWNSRKHCKSSSSYKGVHWSNKQQRWIAKITVNGRRIYGASTKSEVEAAKVYDQMALRYFGEFARLNFP